MPETEKNIQKIQKKIGLLKEEIGKVIIGQEEVVGQALATLFAGGHTLLEGAPGLAKTLLVRTLAAATSLTFKRIQFTPDLMPGDIIGTEVLHELKTGGHEFRFMKGPVFTNILLADEINRTPPKTQSALLEAMQEYEVTYAGTEHKIEKPFFILATQNPVEQAGTFPLPEAQLDRFMTYILLDYPTEQEEQKILESTTGSKGPDPKPVITGTEVIEIQSLVREVSVHPDLVGHINKLTRSTRPSTEEAPDFVRETVDWGAGPRSGQALVLTAKARAFMEGRYSVVPEDIMTMARPVLRHRVLLNFRAEADKTTTDEIIGRLLDYVKLPKAQW